MAYKMMHECGTSSWTVVAKQKTNNQPKSINQTGITISSVGQRFQNCIPGHLSNQDICDLFMEHLDKNVEDKDRQECIKKIQKEKVTGQILVYICKDKDKLLRLYEKLKFPFAYEVCFDQMVDFIRSRHEEFGGSNTQEKTCNNYEGAHPAIFPDCSSYLQNIELPARRNPKIKVRRDHSMRLREAKAVPQYTAAPAVNAWSRTPVQQSGSTRDVNSIEQFPPPQQRRAYLARQSSLQTAPYPSLTLTNSSQQRTPTSPRHNVFMR